MSNTYDQKNILDSISKGDRKAFRRFYDMYYPEIFHFTHFFIQDTYMCKEIVSEVFLSIWQRGESLKKIENLRAYIYRIARNEAFRVLKENRSDYKKVLLDDMPVLLTCKEISPVEKIIDKELIEVYNSAVTELPERCKLIFLMVREQKLKHKEVAEILSIKEGTVESQMNIAINKIIEAVKRKYPSLKLRRTL